jgi:hypothetical protein
MSTPIARAGAARRLQQAWPPTVVHYTFALGSAAYLLAIGLVEVHRRLIQGVPGETITRVFAVYGDTDTWTAPLLSYEGLSGATLALAQAAAVLVALALSFSRRSAPRWIGRLGLLAWTALWTAGAWMYADRAGSLGAWLIAAAYLAPLASTAIVVSRPRRRPRPRREAARPSRARVSDIRRAARTKLRNIPSGDVAALCH